MSDYAAVLRQVYQALRQAEPNVSSTKLASRLSLDAADVIDILIEAEQRGHLQELVILRGDDAIQSIAISWNSMTLDGRRLFGKPRGSEATQS